MTILRTRRDHIVRRWLERAALVGSRHAPWALMLGIMLKNARARRIARRILKQYSVPQSRD